MQLLLRLLLLLLWQTGLRRHLVVVVMVVVAVMVVAMVVELLLACCFLLQLHLQRRPEMKVAWDYQPRPAERQKNFYSDDPFLLLFPWGNNCWPPQRTECGKYHSFVR